MVVDPVAVGRDYEAAVACRWRPRSELAGVEGDTMPRASADHFAHSACRHYRARAISFQWRDAVEAILSSMESKGVIEKVPVGEPFTWCHPMVVVQKQSLRRARITVGLTGAGAQLVGRAPGLFNTRAQ